MFHVRVCMCEWTVSRAVNSTPRRSPYAVGLYFIITTFDDFHGHRPEIIDRVVVVVVVSGEKGNGCAHVIPRDEPRGRVS